MFLLQVVTYTRTRTATQNHCQGRSIFCVNDLPTIFNFTILPGKGWEFRTKQYWIHLERCYIVSGYVYFAKSNGSISLHVLYSLISIVIVLGAYRLISQMSLECARRADMVFNSPSSYNTWLAKITRPGPEIRDRQERHENPDWLVSLTDSYLWRAALTILAIFCML